MRRKTVWKIHSVLGLIAGLPLMIIAATGSILVFTPELSQVLTPELVSVETPHAPRLGLDRLLSSARAELEKTGYEVVGWGISEEPSHADVLFVIKRGDHLWQRVFLDPTTAALQGTPAPENATLLGWLLELHYALLGGHLGMLVTGLLAVVLCLLGLSGMYIYRKFWRNFFMLKWGQSRRAFYGDAHRKLGILSAPLLFILGGTGAYWNIPHAVEDLWKHGFEDHHDVLKGRHYNENISIAALEAATAAEVPGYELRYLALPREADAAITLYGRVPSSNFLRSPYGSLGSFDARSGELISSYDVRSAGYWAQFVDMFRLLHFGSFGGLPVKLIYCILGFSPAFLALSGSYVWFANRRARRKPKRARTRAFDSDDSQSEERRVANA